MEGKYVAMISVIVVLLVTVFYLSRMSKSAKPPINIPVSNLPNPIPVPSPVIPPSVPSPIVPPIPDPLPIPVPNTPPSVPSPIVPPTPKTVSAFDIDKTLTSITGNTGVPIISHKVNQPIFDKAKAADILVIATAREDKYRQDTLTWIEKIGLKPELVLSRPPNDTRPDPDVKYDEMKQIREKYPNSPIIMYDDKPENCNAVIKVSNVTCVLVTQ